MFKTVGGKKAGNVDVKALLAKFFVKAVKEYENDYSCNKARLHTMRKLRDYSNDDSGNDEVETENTVSCNPKFNKQKTLFDNMLKSKRIESKSPIMSMMITYDSSKVFTVTKMNDIECRIKQYDLVTYQITFSETIGGKPGDHIKLKEIEQSSDGKKYALVYNNDGIYVLRTFGKVTRTQTEIEENEVNLNTILGL